VGGNENDCDMGLGFDEFDVFLLRRWAIDRDPMILISPAVAAVALADTVGMSQALKAVLEHSVGKHDRA
jgi:hypothetical protein